MTLENTASLEAVLKNVKDRYPMIANGLDPAIRPMLE